MIALKSYVLLLSLHYIRCHLVLKEQTVYDPKLLATVNDDCDPSTIPVMDSFDMEKFSGKWFELAKTSAGYMDVSDGVWILEGTNTSSTFRFSGRDNNEHCIRPLKGKISASVEPPGLLNLRYKTYSTHVEETIRVLFTDYVSMAVIYTCMYHVHHEKEVCHAAGLFGAIWTRKPHADVELFENAARYLEMACIHKSTIIVRNVVGACRIEGIDPRIDDFPAPDYCYQPMDLGSCRGSLQRYYFEPKEKTCKTFTFGGCGGNKNNFMSLLECQKNCISDSSKDPVCMSIAKCGLHCSPCCTEDRIGCVKCDCEHIIEENFLNCVKNPLQCGGCEVETFHPGCHICRCGGEHKTNQELPAVCNEVKAIGKCNSNFTRFYYNAAVDQCEKFEFSGCYGNNNNFRTLLECKERCQREERKSEPPILQGGPIPDSSVVVNYNLWLIIFLTMWLAARQ